MNTIAIPFVSSDDEEDRFLPEGPRPIVIGGREAVMWVNIQTSAESTRGALHARFWDDGELNVWNLADRPGFVFPTDREGFVFVGMGKQLGTLHLETNEFIPLANIDDDNPRTIVNDGEVVPGGRAIVFGTKDVKFANPIAKLYLFTLDDNRVTVLADGQTCSNGKVIAPSGDGYILYDIDTPTKTVVRYRLDIANRSAVKEGVAVDTQTIAGFPDGMRDCGDGTAVIAFYNPEPVEEGRAVRFDLRTGQMMGEWSIPHSPRVTCPCLVSQPDGVKVIFTTATEGMPAADRESCKTAGDLVIAHSGLSVCPAYSVVKL